MHEKKILHDLLRRIQLRLGFVVPASRRWPAVVLVKVPSDVGGATSGRNTLCTHSW